MSRSVTDGGEALALQHNSRSRTAVITALLTVMPLSAPHLTAQSRGAIVPSVSFGTVHDDNLFSTRRAIGDYMTQVRPSLEGIFRTPRVNIQSDFSIDMQMSARHAALSTFDARRHGLFDARVQSTPALNLGFVGRYDTTDTPAELNFESGVMVDRRRAQRWQLTPSIGYRTSPRTTLNLQYDWINESLGEWWGGSLHSGRFAVARQQSPRTTWSVQYLGRLFLDSSTGLAFTIDRARPVPEHWSQSALVGWNRQLTPLTRLSLLAGPRVTSYRGVTTEVLGTLVRRTPYSRILTDYWHGETIVLGIVGPVRIHSGTVKWTRTVERNLDLGVTAGAFHSTALDGAVARVVHTAVTGAWHFGGRYLLTSSYGADFQRGDIRSALLSGARIRRGIFLLRLTIRPRVNGEIELPEDPDRPVIPVKGVIK